MASIEQSLRPRDIGHRFAYKITEKVDCIDVPKRSEFCDRLDALLSEFVQEIADTKPVPADEVLAKKRKIELRHQKQKELEHHHKNMEKQIEFDGINTRGKSISLDFLPTLQLPLKYTVLQLLVL